MKEKIKWCPFCGGAGEVVQRINGYIVSCSHCKSNSGAYDTPEKAVKAWNIRKPEIVRGVYREKGKA